MTRLYLDANVIIYFVEGIEALRTVVLDWIDLVLLEVTQPVLARAVEIRAKYGFKTPDAIHLATAVLHDADAFLTSDGPLEKFEELPVHLLKP